jgi:N12 class adenine-specific DNA methylase
MDFELLGCDALFLDEFQVYKNLHFYTKQNNIAGLTNRASLISMDMYLKLRYIKSIPQGRIIGATGTPITNTISELFTLQRYFQAEELEQRGIESFDSWASVKSPPRSHQPACTR